MIHRHYQGEKKQGNRAVPSQMERKLFKPTQYPQYARVFLGKQKTQNRAQNRSNKQF